MCTIYDIYPANLRYEVTSADATYVHFGYLILNKLIWLPLGYCKLSSVFFFVNFFLLFLYMATTIYQQKKIATFRILLADDDSVTYERLSSSFGMNTL